MTAHKVIVFGPTGAVGSAAASTAQQHGAKVYLAMRDVEKPIRGFDKEKEKEMGYERIHADLTKPETVQEAVTKSGAQYAFIYLAHAAKDHMRGTIEALKAGGIKLVVFLSSLSVLGNIREIKPEAFIAYAHAQVEVVLEEVFGHDGFVALRGGAFASNIMWYKAGLMKGEARIMAPETQTDNIVPADIGRLAGMILAKGKLVDNGSHIYVYGPELMTLEDTVNIAGKELGKQVKVVSIDAAEQRQMWIDQGFQPSGADYMISIREKTVPGACQIFGIMVEKEDFKNVEKYTGEPPTTYAQWVKDNKHLFES